MRTILPIDDATAKALKDRAHRSGRSFKEVVNEAPRAGLSARQVPSAKPYRVKPGSLDSAVPGINPDQALALADALEDRGIAAEIERRK